MRACIRSTVVGLVCAVIALVPETLQAQGTSQQGTQGTPLVVPGLALRTLRGDTVRVGAGSRPTLVAVFASWCRSCRDEVATFNRLQRELAPLGVRLLALSADDGSDERLQAWLTRQDAQYPVARDTSRAALKALGVVGVPEAHLVGADGRILWSRRGPIESGLASLRRAVAATRAADKAAGNPAPD